MGFKLKNAPEYLKESEWYITTYNLYGEEGEVEVGKWYPPENQNVNNLEDFENLFHTYEIWGLNHGEQFLKFILTNRDEVLEFLFNMASGHTQAKILLKKMMDADLKFNIKFNLKEKNVPLPYDADQHRENRRMNSNLYELQFGYKTNFFTMIPYTYNVYITDNKYLYISIDYGFDDKVNNFLLILEEFIKNLRNGTNSKLKLSTYSTRLETFEILANKLRFVDVWQHNSESINEFELTELNRANVIHEFEKLYDAINNV